MTASPRVLLVDDRDDKLLAMEAVLDSLGVEITKARSGREALELCKACEFAVILMDVRMPGMNGFEAAATIRKLGRCTRVPIIFVSAAEGSELIEQGYALGAVDYIQNLEPQILRAKVSVFVDLFRKHQEVLEHREAELKLRHDKQRAERANEAKDRFIAALSHELRTPLTPVIALLPTLMEDQDLSEDARNDLRMIYENVQIEAQLVNDLLDLTSITQGKFPLNLQRADVHLLITQAVAAVRAEARAKGIALHLELYASHLVAWVDVIRIKQVLWNLLRNAIRYTPPNGGVWVRTRSEQAGRILLEIADSGIGFSPEEGARLFQPFERPAAAEGHKFGGLGLGLFIAFNIVAQHESTLCAESSGKGQGAAFRFQLRAAEGAAAAPPVSPSIRGRRGGTLRILLVEDHENTRVVMSRLLTKRGHFVMTAETVQQAREVAAGNEFDFIVSDLGLPDGSGLQLMTEFRSLYNVQGIAVSGYGMEDDVQRSHNAGFSAHLTKPVDFEVLEAAIARFSGTEGSV